MRSCCIGSADVNPSRSRHIFVGDREHRRVNYAVGARSIPISESVRFVFVIAGKLKGAVRTTLRRSERIQDTYERYKNRRRREVLMAVIPAGGVGAELGVHKGHLTPLLVEWLEPKKLYAVDPWYLLGPTWEWAAGDKSTVNALARTIRRLRPSIESGQVDVVVQDDLVFLSDLSDGALDWVYIDSSHMYDHTIKELEILLRKVKPGGIIAGDDWQPDPQHRHHGVCKAVREFEAAGHLNIIYSDSLNHQWASRVPSRVPSPQ